MKDNYNAEALSDAKDTVRCFEDEIVDQLVDRDEASDDLLNDYANGDAYHHESHTDKTYNLREAAEVLEQLRDYEETDSGLWASLGPREAISAMAAYTYANAVYAKWQELIEEINQAARDAFDDLELIELEGEEADDSAKMAAAQKVIDEILA